MPDITTARKLWCVVMVSAIRRAEPGRKHGVAGHSGAQTLALPPSRVRHGRAYLGNKALKPGISTSKARWISQPAAMAMIRIEPQRITYFL